MILSDQDEREFRILKLKNGLDVVLIRDDSIGKDDSSSSSSEDENEDDQSEEEEKTSSASRKAACSLAVGVGSFSDPEGFGGLAHFCEHMLFMGTKTYPCENEFESFLSRHGGSSNAFTDQEATVFAFDVRAKYLKGALNRFARFFTEPLMKADTMGRELEAVDSEFIQAKTNDGPRLEQLLLCCLSRDGHVTTNFSWGNRKSLIGKDESPEAYNTLREKLLKFHRERYSANSMKLCVLTGGESLDHTESLVRDLFEKIPCPSNSRPSFSSHGSPLDEKTRGTLTVMSAVKEQHTLRLFWDLKPSTCRDEVNRRARRASDYVSALIGHECENSILAALKRRRWATELSAGVDVEQGWCHNTAFSYFEVSMKLTKEGLLNVSEIVDIVIAYIGMLRRVGVQKWFWDEEREIQSTAFRFESREDSYSTAEMIASQMLIYPLEFSVFGPYAWGEIEPKSVNDVLAQLHPSRLISILSSPIDGDNKVGGHELTNMEPWFEVPYVTERFESNVIKRWISLYEEKIKPYETELQFPKPNPFLVSKKGLCLKPIENSEHHDIPVLADHVDRRYNVWHKQDRTFLKPKAHAWFLLCCPGMIDSVDHLVLTEILLALFEDRMTPLVYQADVGQLGCSLRIVDDGLSLHVYGFNAKLKGFVLQLARGLAMLSEWKELETRLQVAKETLSRGYRNKFLKPSGQSKYMRLRMLLDRGVYSPTERLAALEKCDVDTVRSHCQALFGEKADRHSFMQVFVMGNVVPEESIEISKQVAEILKMCPMEEKSTNYGRTKSKCVVVPNDRTLRSTSMCFNRDEGNSVTEIYFQLLASSLDESCYVDVLSQIIDEPFYDVLRTKMQLGYYVDASSRMTAQVLGFCFIVKGDAVTAEESERRVMQFISDFHDCLKKMPESEFVQHRRAVAQEKLEPDDSMGDEARRLYGEISSGRFEFTRWSKESSRIMNISQKDFTKWFYARFFSVTSRRVVIHVRSSKAPKGYRGTKRYEKVKYCSNDERSLLVVTSTFGESSKESSKESGESSKESGESSKERKMMIPEEDDKMSVKELHSSLQFHKDSLSIIKDSRNNNKK